MTRYDALIKHIMTREKGDMANPNRINVSFDEETANRVKAMAKDDGRSDSSMVVKLTKKALDALDKSK